MNDGYNKGPYKPEKEMCIKRGLRNEGTSRFRTFKCFILKNSTNPLSIIALVFLSVTSAVIVCKFCISYYPNRFSFFLSSYRINRYRVVLVHGFLKLN